MRKLTLHYWHAADRVAESFKLSHQAASAIVLSTAALFITGFIIVWCLLLPWTAKWDVAALVGIALAILAARYAWMAKQARLMQQETTESPPEPIPEGTSETTVEMDETAEILPPSVIRRWRAGRPKRTVVEDDDGTLFLVVSRWEAVRTRLRKRQWDYVEQSIELKRSPLVDPPLAKRTAFDPISNESTIYCLTRLHWWSHGPQQIVVGLITVVGLLLPVFTPVFESFSLRVSALALLAWILVGMIAYAVVWVQWAFTYLIVTDKRLLLIYAPPLWLPGHGHQAPLYKLQGANHEESVWGNIVGYGTITNETTATDTDAWIRDGIKYVRQYKDVEKLLSEFEHQNGERQPLV